MLDFSHHPFDLADPPPSTRPSPWFLLLSGVVDGTFASVAGLADAMLAAGFGVSTIAEIHSCSTTDIIAEFAGRGLVVEPEQIDRQLKTRKGGWSAADVFCLIVCWLMGMPAKEIGARLNRKPSQIYSKRRRCGLPSRRKRSGESLQDAVGESAAEGRRARRKKPAAKSGDVEGIVNTAADPRALSPSAAVEDIAIKAGALRPTLPEVWDGLGAMASHSPLFEQDLARAHILAEEDAASVVSGSQSSKLEPASHVTCDAQVLSAVSRIQALISRFPEPPRRVPNYERDLEVCARRLGGQSTKQIARGFGVKPSTVSNVLTKKGLVHARKGEFGDLEEFDEERFEANMREFEPARCGMRKTLFYRKKGEGVMYCQAEKKKQKGKEGAKEPEAPKPEQTPPPEKTDKRCKPWVTAGGVRCTLSASDEFWATGLW